MSGGPRGIISNRSRRKFLKVVTSAAAAAPLLLARKAFADASDQGCESSDYQPKSCHCLLRGTEITTARGAMPVEELAIGDLILTESGQFEPVKWIARQTIEKPLQDTWRDDVVPICIAQSAIDQNLPRRDLFLSPGHCLFIDGYLIPADYLVNGTSIVQVVPPGVDVLDYFHVEFERHDVMYADGVPVESMHLPDGRSAEARDFLDYERLYGSRPPRPMAPYAPILGYRGLHGNTLALARAALSRWIDVRDPIQVAYDRLAARAALLKPNRRTAEPASA